jgi:O-Antigen ligase
VLAWPAMDVAPERVWSSGQRFAGWCLWGTSTALLVGAVFFGGGSGESSVPWLGALAVLAAGASVVAAAAGFVELPRLERYGAAAAAAGLLLLVWGGLSLWWSIAADRSWEALNKGLVYASFAVLGVALARQSGSVRRLGLVLAAILLLALAWALAGKAVPALFPDGDRATRLRSPVGYWNGLALLADAAVPLGLWLVTSWRRRGVRATGAALTYVAVAALLMTQSRAGVLGGIAVVAVWMWLTPLRVESGLLLGLGGLPALVVGAWAFTRPALVEDGVTRGARVDDGRLFAVAAVVGLAIAVGLSLAVPVSRLARERRRWLGRGLVAACVASIALALVALVVVVGNPVSWGSNQFTEGECANDPGRLTTLCANNRIAWWGEALDVAADRPLAGSGARTFEIARKRYRDDATSVSQPHSVPLQLLSDTGIVGLLLGLGLAAALGAAIVAAIRRLDAEERAAGCALVALPLAFVLHSLVDYDLDFLALAAPTLLVSFGLAGAQLRALDSPRGVIPVVGAAAVTLAIVFVVVSPSLAGREVDSSTRALDDGSAKAAAEAADRARSLNPLALDPVFARARAAELAGDEALARALYQKAVAMQPENPAPWIELGLFELYGTDDACAGYSALNAAYTLDPGGRQWVVGGPLDQARDEVNRGACER